MHSGIHPAGLYAWKYARVPVVKPSFLTVWHVYRLELNTEALFGCRRSLHSCGSHVECRASYTDASAMTDKKEKKYVATDHNARRTI